MNILRLIKDYNILNRDIRPDNFIVSPLPNKQNNYLYSVYIIDFGLCRIRGKDKTDFEWERAKLTKDEEEAVGLII